MRSSLAGRYDSFIAVYLLVALALSLCHLLIELPTVRQELHNIFKHAVDNGST